MNSKKNQIDESPASKIVCLMYHRFAGREAYEWLEGTERIFTTPIDNFEEQIQYLKHSGYTFVTADEVDEFVRGSAELYGKNVFITIDDGCRSTQELGWPILRKYGAKATAFITTDPQSHVFYIDSRSNGRLSDEEIRVMDGEVIQIESHAVSHKPLSGMNEEEIHRELLESKRTLETLVSREVKFLAIPGNWFNDKIMNIAEKVGYQAVWVSNPGVVRKNMKPFGLPRINVEGNWTLQRFIKALTPMGILKRRVVSGIKRCPGRVLGPRLWLPIRGWVMGLIPGGHLSYERMLIVTSVIAVMVVIGAGTFLVF